MRYSEAMTKFTVTLSRTIEVDAEDHEEARKAAVWDFSMSTDAHMKPDSFDSITVEPLNA